MTPARRTARKPTAQRSIANSTHLLSIKSAEAFTAKTFNSERRLQLEALTLGGEPIDDISIQVGPTHTARHKEAIYTLSSYRTDRRFTSGVVWSSFDYFWTTQAKEHDSSPVIREIHGPSDWAQLDAATGGQLHSTLAVDDLEKLENPFGKDLFDTEDLKRTERNLRKQEDVKALGVGGGKRMAAARYALQYALGTNWFHGRVGEDCTNFVSQCMRAGGWSVNWNGSHQDVRSWYFKRQGYRYAYSWVNVDYFRQYTTVHSKRTRLASHATDLWHGNFIQVRTTGNKWIHTVIVTGRQGGLPLYSSHTNNRRNAPFNRLRNGFNVTGWAFHLT